MGKHNWEYNYDGKTYRVQTLGEFVGDDKFYYINRLPTLDRHRKSGVWKQIDANNFVFVWSKYVRKLHCMREKWMDKNINLLQLLENCAEKWRYKMNEKRSREHKELHDSIQMSDEIYRRFTS